MAPHLEDMLDSYGKDTDEADEEEDDGRDEDEWPDDPDMPQLFESTAKEILNGTKEVGSRLRPYIVLAFASLVPLMRRAWAERRDDFAETLKKRKTSGTRTLRCCSATLRKPRWFVLCCGRRQSKA